MQNLISHVSNGFIALEMLGSSVGGSPAALTVNHSLQDISASVVKEVGRRGGGQKKKSPGKNLHSTELVQQGNGNTMNTNTGLA